MTIIEMLQSLLERGYRVSIVRHGLSWYACDIYDGDSKIRGSGSMASLDSAISYVYEFAQRRTDPVHSR